MEYKDLKTESSTTSEPALKDRWAAAGFGPIAPNSLPDIEIIPTPEQADKEAIAKERRREYLKGKEAVTEARLRVTLDKEAILGIENQLDEFTSESSYFGTDEEKAAEKQARHEELMETVNAIASLPEHLDFEPGITLIVGASRNGLGKSTLARALIYAARIAHTVTNPTYRSDGEYPTHEEARDMILRPSRSSPDEITELYESGLAPFFAEHIRVDELTHGAPGFRYYDIPTEFGRKYQMSRELGRGHYGFDSEGHNISSEGRYDRRGRSHRQTVDNMLEQTIERDKRERQRDKSDWIRNHEKEFGPDLDFGAPQVMVIDEPENGMSVRRHLEIESYLKGLVPEGSVTIVPTNSTELYKSDLPRIDLEHPERGIHRPSEYPD